MSGNNFPWPQPPMQQQPYDLITHQNNDSSFSNETENETIHPPRRNDNNSYPPPNNANVSQASPFFPPAYEYQGQDLVHAAESLVAAGAENSNKRPYAAATTQNNRRPFQPPPEDDDEDDDDDSHDFPNKRQAIATSTSTSTSTSAPVQPQQRQRRQPSGEPRAEKYTSDKFPAVLEFLIQYKQEHGHTNVPKAHAPNRMVGNFVFNVRNSRIVLAAEHRQQLVDIGFDFSTRAERDAQIWTTHLKELLDYRKEQKTWNVSESKDGGKYRPLAKWVFKPRKQYARGDLDPDRLQALSEVGFDFQLPRQHRKVKARGDAEKRQQIWETMYAKLVEYHGVHGHCTVSARSTDPETKKLAEWVNTNRTAEALGEMLPERKEKLQAIGFAFRKKERSRENTRQKALESKIQVRQQELKLKVQELNLLPPETFGTKKKHELLQMLSEMDMIDDILTKFREKWSS